MTLPGPSVHHTSGHHLVSTAELIVATGCDGDEIIHDDGDGGGSPSVRQGLC